MAKYKYQNTSNKTQHLVGFGVVAAGDTIETDREVTNGNFKPVAPKKSAATNKKNK